MSRSDVKTSNGATVLEELLQLSAEIGVEGAVLFVGLFSLYLVVGGIVRVVLEMHTPYPFLSPEADPILLIEGTVIGAFTIQGAGSLLLYHFYEGVTNESVWSVVLSLVALGIGGRLLQITLPESWDLLTGSVVLFPIL
jgi:hypothetical protein